MTKKSRPKYKEKLTIREIPRSTVSAEEKLNMIADIIIERIFEVYKDRNNALQPRTGQNQE